MFTLSFAITVERRSDTTSNDDLPCLVRFPLYASSRCCRPLAEVGSLAPPTEQKLVRISGMSTAYSKIINCGYCPQVIASTIDEYTHLHVFRGRSRHQTNPEGFVDDIHYLSHAEYCQAKAQGLQYKGLE
ncbi:unnamed protein product [Somion occarium]|uniref:Uncharacterized protein n=1 Tax=Somion occarium TaxID=3059160 RepID=A0ABP1DUW7_9APHY